MSILATLLLAAGGYALNKLEVRVPAKVRVPDRVKNSKPKPKKRKKVTGAREGNK